ncbi:MAG: heme ABC exporter ATP-binding protein CcmA [Chloroflexi bacterium]|nr:heme ABC exporter ATP-binding protein CcmA [Chloroflexota bacterium]
MTWQDGRTKGEWVVEVERLIKYYGSKPVLTGLELKVAAGDFVTIFGSNGAGKTTLIKILSTIMKASSGKVTIAGLDIRHQAARVRQRIGLVSHDLFLYENLTAYENLKFYGMMYNVPDLEQCIRTVIAQVGMEARLHDRVCTLSHGMRRRISIARAVLHKPDILLLDEPESGLDQQSSQMLADLLCSLVQGQCTVIMTTHNLERGLRLGTRAAILARGKIVRQESQPLPDVESFATIYRQHTGAQ